MMDDMISRTEALAMQVAAYEAAADLIRSNELLHGSDGDEMRPRTDGNRNGLAFADAILALATADQRAALDRLIADKMAEAADRTETLVQAVLAEMKARNAHEALPADRGGQFGPKGQAMAAWLNARSDVALALLALKGGAV